VAAPARIRQGIGALVISTEPPVNEPDVARRVIFPGVVVERTIASALPLKADREVP
jgi:hypothetical protein